MQLTSKLRSLGSKLQTVALVAPIALASGVARADGSDPFTDAVTSATTKIGVYAAALVGVAAIGVVFMIGKKYVKKIPGSA